MVNSGAWFRSLRKGLELRGLLDHTRKIKIDAAKQSQPGKCLSRFCLTALRGASHTSHARMNITGCGTF